VLITPTPYYLHVIIAGVIFLHNDTCFEITGQESVNKMRIISASML